MRSRLLVKKAGIVDAVGLVDGLYAGAASAGFRTFPDSATVKPPRIAEVYTRGTLTLARLGREAPIAAANPAGAVLRNVEGGSLAARLLYPEIRQSRPPQLPRSPVIGTTRQSSTSSARTSACPQAAARARVRSRRRVGRRRPRATTEGHVPRASKPTPPPAADPSGRRKGCC